MKRLVAVSALAGVLATGLVSLPAHAVPTVSWSTPTLDWQLIDNPDTVATDVYTRPKATITYQWSSTGDSGTNCVAWHVDGSSEPAFTTTLSNIGETLTSDNVDFAAGAYSTSIVYDWTEITELLELDPSTTHDIEVQVHDVGCNSADFDGDGVTGSATLQLASAPSATPQGWDWAATLGLTEDAANAAEQPDLGGTPNDDDWIYPGEDATFNHTWVSSSGPVWNGPVRYLGEEISSTDVCFIDVVNQDDVHVDPETANTARGYDYMNIGYVATSVAHENGDGELTLSDPKGRSRSDTYAWNSLISSGFNSGAYSFDPTQVNSITRYIFQGNCYEIFNYGTASGSSSNTSTPVNEANNWASEQRYLNAGSPTIYREWDYYWHPRAAADITGDIWAARATAISTETLYLGPAETTIATDDPSIARGDTVNLSKDFFDGNGQCVAVFIDDVFETSAAAGADGPGSDSTPYTYEDLIDLYGLDNTVEHTIEWRIFGQTCASIDESTATPAGTASVTLEPDVSTVGADVASAAIGDEINVDLDWFDGTNQCFALYIDDVLEYTETPSESGGPGTDSYTYTWDSLIEVYNLDPSVSHTFEWRIYNGACEDINVATATPMDTASVTLDALAPSIDVSSPDVGPGESATINTTWANPEQCVALFIDDEFILWSHIDAESDTFGSSSTPNTWQGWVEFIAFSTGDVVDLSVEHTISLRLYDDAQADPDNCLNSATPTIDLLSVDGIDLTVLPLEPNLDASKDSVGPNDESELNIDRETYGNLVAARFINNVFVGCMLVSEIPDTVDWDSLDNTYSRDASHTVTYAVYPIVGDGLDMDECDGPALSGFTPLTFATVTLMPAALASTGVEIGALGALGALAIALGVRMTIRRRRISA
jgi:hypothetical protein